LEERNFARMDLARRTRVTGWRFFFSVHHFGFPPSERIKYL
jgi:hypothetical protein